MITVKLKGGLGNQLFQFALGRHVAVRRDTDLSFDLSWFGNEQHGETPRRYTLAPYELEVSLDGHRHPSSRPDPKTRVGRFLARRDPRLLQQLGQRFDLGVLDAPDGSLLDGYWQNENYFLPIASVVRRDLTLSRPPEGRNAELFSRIGSRPAVGVHIRRGDYVTNPSIQAFHGMPGVRWYHAAVELIGGRVPGAELFVFSDDPDWAEANFQPDYPTTYVSDAGGAPHEDLRLLAACRHHVLSNSSFSWWGAWLGGTSDQVAIAPHPWFRRVPAATREVVRASWITLPIDMSTRQPQA